MLKNEIKEKILEITSKKKFIDFLELSETFDVSISTVKRYSKELEMETKSVSIIRGGISSSKFYEMSHDEKAIINVSAKNRIAKKAVALIEPYDVIFIDAGTTTSEIFKLIKPLEGLVIFTNNLSAASQINIENVRVYLIGGKIKYKTSALTGSWAIDFIRNIRFTKSFIGANAYNEGFCFTTNSEEALFKRTIINQSTKSFVLADSTKFGKSLPYIVSNSKDVIFINEN